MGGAQCSVRGQCSPDALVHISAVLTLLGQLNFVTGIIPSLTRVLGKRSLAPSALA